MTRLIGEPKGRRKERAAGTDKQARRVIRPSQGEEPRSQMAGSRQMSDATIENAGGETRQAMLRVWMAISAVWVTFWLSIAGIIVATAGCQSALPAPRPRRAHRHHPAPRPSRHRRRSSAASSKRSPGSFGATEVLAASLSRLTFPAAADIQTPIECSCRRRVAAIEWAATHENHPLLRQLQHLGHRDPARRQSALRAGRALARRAQGTRSASEWTVIAEGLAGRTTVHPDPIEGAWLDGSAYLLPCLRSHRPLDLVAIMLGTNDLKQRFCVPPTDIAKGVGRAAHDREDVRMRP